jgi:hypothetical protein
MSRKRKPTAADERELLSFSSVRGLVIGLPPFFPLATAAGRFASDVFWPAVTDRLPGEPHRVAILLVLRSRTPPRVS